MQNCPLRILIPLAAGTALLLSASVSRAAIVTVSGTTVDFTYDNSIFGTATVLGDILSFNPSGFEASASGDGASQIRSNSAQPLTVIVTAKTGSFINSFNFSEGGSFNTLNVTTPSDALGALANLDFTPDLGPASSASIAAILNTTLAVGPIKLGDWNIFKSYTGLAANALDFTLVDYLVAATAAGQSATITKANLSVAVSTSPVPLPPAVWLLGSSLVALSAISRNRRTQNGKV